MNVTKFTILFRREHRGMGDLAIALRAMEITKMTYPHSCIIVQSQFPNLLKTHPAIAQSLSLTDVIPEYDVMVNLIVPPSYEMSKHELFCIETSKALAKLGLPGIIWDGRPQSLWVTSESHVSALREVKHICKGRIPIGIFWQSEAEFRTWHGMPELVELLIQNDNVCVFCFDRDDSICLPHKIKKACSRLSGMGEIANPKEPRILHSLEMKLNMPLEYVMAMVSCMKIVITNDSGGLHLAGGLGVPVFSIFGATDPKMLASMYAHSGWIKVDCKHHPCWYRPCLLKKSCLSQLTVPAVLNAFNDFTKQEKPVQGCRGWETSANQKNRESYLGMKHLWGLPDKEPLAGQDTHLIVRFRGIGDVGMTIFGLEFLREKYPNDHITYLTSPESAALFCGQKGLVDKVIPMTYKHHALPDTVPIPIDTSDYTYIYNLMNAVDFHLMARCKPRADNFADLMGVTIKRDRPVRQLIISESEKDAMKIRLDLKGGENTWYIACQLDADGIPRRWFTKYWIELAERVGKRFSDCKLLFLGRETLNGIVPDNVINLSGNTSVREFITVISLSKILIGTDSSGLHIGGRLPIKVLALIGSTGKAENGGGFAHTNYYDNVTHIRGKCKFGLKNSCFDWQFKSCMGKRHWPNCLHDLTPKKVFTVLCSLIECDHH